MTLKIDSHHHFWKYNDVEYSWIDDQMAVLKMDFLPKELNSLIDQADIDGTVVVQARQSLEETEWLLHLADENEFINGVVGWVDLCSDQIESQLEKFAFHPKLVGIRHVIQDEADEDFILRKDFANGISLLKKYNLTYDILIFARHLPQTIKFVENFPNQIFVLDHIAKPEIKNHKLSPWKEDIIELGRHKNVFCKLSGMVTEADWKNWSAKDFRPYLDIVTEAFKTDRLMFGSDWPVCLLTGSYSKILTLVNDYFSEFSEDEKKNLFGLTAMKVYDLEG